MKNPHPQPAQFSLKELFFASVLTFLGMVVLNFVIFADNPALGCVLAVLGTLLGGMATLQTTTPDSPGRMCVLPVSVVLSTLLMLGLGALFAHPHRLVEALAVFALLIVLPLAVGVGFGCLIFPKSFFKPKQVWERRGLIGCTAFCVMPFAMGWISDRFFRTHCGGTETAAASMCKAYAEAQEIYHRSDYDGDGVLEYAQSMFGPKSLGDPDLLLIDPAFADAAWDAPERSPKAGYFFKVIHMENEASYIDAKGDQVFGYAVVAFPAEYGVTGTNAYAINHTGVIYQRDLGPETERIASQMTEFLVSDEWIPTE